jgi:hypothetical protein
LPIPGTHYGRYETHNKSIRTRALLVGELIFN